MRMESAHKREERAGLKRQKELERMRKEQAKLSAQEQARLAAEAFEHSLDVLLSVHRTASSTFDWMKPLCALPPHKPTSPDWNDFEKERADGETCAHSQDASSRAKARLRAGTFPRQRHGELPARSTLRLPRRSRATTRARYRKLKLERQINANLRGLSSRTRRPVRFRRGAAVYEMSVNRASRP